MTPHFIFNSLSVLQGMILNKEEKKSIFYLSKFSKLLRITLENSRDKLVPLNQEMEAVNNYLELQNLEASQSYDYTILVDKNIDETLFKIPPMLIQPFIENAIEHAFEDRKDNRKIDIQLKYISEELICTIKDNGIGIDAQNGHKRKDKKSLATTITSERLKMLSKDFNIEGSVHIEDRKQYNEQGTIVTLVIPYKKDVA
jgi:sensor histidine kinase YesM